MTDHDRRTFLKTGAAALSAAALGGCAPDGDRAPRPALDPELLRAVGRLVLPTELGDGGVEDAVSDFERWLDGFEPATERNHGYGTSEIRYGPPDPAFRWAAQLEALDAEARSRHDAGFSELSRDRQEAILRRRLDPDSDDVPPPARARHVAVGLLARWLDTPEARDRCYGVRIRARSCRGLSETADRPRPLTAGEIG